MSEKKRFKHKLNMLELGTKMLKGIGILALAGFILYLFRLKTEALCLWLAGGVLFLILLVLLAVESYQDKVMNDIALEENKKNGVL